jgi:DNA invertase Pin-like site-specific DNA recombinase
MIHGAASAMKVCRIYQRVSSDQQDLSRQQVLEEQARAAGYYIAGVYREKASGTTAERPELQRMIRDLQPGEVVIAEKIDRISRLPLADAEKLVATIKDKGARLAIPGIVDLSELVAESNGVAKIVLESVQSMLLRIALQMARDDWETRKERQRHGVELAKQIPGKYAGRKADTATHERIIELREAGRTIAETAKRVGCSTAQVKRIWAKHQGSKATA